MLKKCLIERFGLVASDYESERRSPETFFRPSHMGRFMGTPTELSGLARLPRTGDRSSSDGMGFLP